MKTLKPKDEVVVLRDIYRHDGPPVEVPRTVSFCRYDGGECVEKGTYLLPGTVKVRTRVLYAKAGTAGTVLETFRTDDGRWNVKVLIDGKCLTFRQTSLARKSDFVFYGVCHRCGRHAPLLKQDGICAMVTCRSALEETCSGERTA